MTTTPSRELHASRGRRRSAEAATLALHAGVDIDMMADAYRHGLPLALERGLVDLAQIDEAVRRVLHLKEQLGLFDDPYGRGAAPESAEVLSARRDTAPRRRGQSGAVTDQSSRHAATACEPATARLIGPLADAGAEMRGSWWAAAEPDATISVLTGLRAALPATHIAHAAGVPIEANELEGIAAALAVCEAAETIILCLGEAALMSGEAASRAQLDLPGQQRRLAEAVLARARELKPSGDSSAFQRAAAGRALAHRAGRCAGRGLVPGQ